MSPTNRITRIVAAAVAAFAIGAPVAGAMPITEPTAVSSLVATSSDQGQDLRSPDAAEAATSSAPQGLPTWPTHPQVLTPPQTVQATGDDDTSPWVFIIPGVVLTAMLAAALAYTLRPSARARRAHA